MYNIKAPRSVTEKAWGLNFIDGEAETDNKALAQKLQSKGYKVTEKKPEAKKN